MEIQRTANAGVLLTLDGTKLLLDGLCDGVDGYLPTPPEMLGMLWDKAPDALLFTHRHADHYSSTLVSQYTKRNLRPIYGPESVYGGPFRIGNLNVTPIPSRHIGKTEPGLTHHSFIVEGSKCVWFVGDATPTQWRGREDLRKPDVLIAPYAYANTKTGWETACSLTENLVLLHLPAENSDPYGLRKQVAETVSSMPKIQVFLPNIGETVKIK